MRIVRKFLNSGSIENTFDLDKHQENTEPWVSTKPHADGKLTVTFNFERLGQVLQNALSTAEGYFKYYTGLSDKNLSGTIYDTKALNLAYANKHTKYKDSIGKEQSSFYNPYLVELTFPDYAGATPTKLTGLTGGIKVADLVGKPAGPYRGLKAKAGPNAGKVLEVLWDGEKIIESRFVDEAEEVTLTIKSTKLPRKPRVDVPTRIDKLSKSMQKTINAEKKAIRSKYDKILKDHADKYGLHWQDLHPSGYLRGMLDDMKTPEWLETYYDNVVKIAIPLAEELIKEGKLVKTTRGWEGFINGSMRSVDPTKYVVSQMEKFLKSGNHYFGGLNYLQTGKDVGDALQFGYNGTESPIYTITGVGNATDFYVTHAFDPATNLFRTLQRINRLHPSRVSVPIVNPNVNPALIDTHVGMSTNRFVNGTLGDYVGTHPLYQVIKAKGIKDDAAIGSDLVDEVIYFPKNIEGTIKSWWNNLNFEPGSGWFTQNLSNPIIDKLNFT